LVLVAMTRLAFADSGSTAPPTQPPVEHHGLGIVFVLVTAVGLLILSKVLPRATRREKPKAPPEQ
jgi:hypothetical protein